MIESKTITGDPVLFDNRFERFIKKNTKRDENYLITPEIIKIVDFDSNKKGVSEERTVIVFYKLKKIRIK